MGGTFRSSNGDVQKKTNEYSLLETNYCMKSKGMKRSQVLLTGGLLKMGPSMMLETLASQITVCRPVDKAFVEAC